MTTPSLLELRTDELRDRVRRREVRAAHTVAASLDAVAATKGGEGGLNYMLWTDRDAAIADAREADRRMDAAPASGALAGVPVAITLNLAWVRPQDPAAPADVGGSRARGFGDHGGGRGGAGHGLVGHGGAGLGGLLAEHELVAGL